MQSGGNLRHLNGELRIGNWAERRGPAQHSARFALCPLPFARVGRGRRDETRGLGWLRSLLAVVLLVASWSCKQTKEITIPDPNSNATALYVLKILNIQPDDIDMNTEGTASATIFARLTDARGNPLANQVLFFEVGDVPGVSFTAATRTEETTEEQVLRIVCQNSICEESMRRYLDCPSGGTPPNCPFVVISVSVKDTLQACTGDQAGTLPGSIFGDLSFRYRTTDGDGRAQSVFTSARVKKFFDLAFAALTERAQLCLGVAPGMNVETTTETEDTEVNDPGFCSRFGFAAPCVLRTITTTRKTTVAIAPIRITLDRSTFELPIRVRWNDPQYNLQVFDVRPLEVHIPQFWHD